VNVSGPYEVPVPSEHPNNDLLADLAAEVLADDLAGHVQDHVIGCSRCAAVLADAESVRAMLLQIEPEQMPDEVLARLERALKTARREDESTAAGDGAETRVLGRLSLGSDTARSDPGRRIPRSGNVAGPATGRIAPAAGLTGSMATMGPKTSRLNRMSAPAQSARRQAIEEQKADQPSRLSRLAPILRIAAGVLVVAGVGVGVMQLRGDGGSSADQATSAGSGSAPAPIVAPVQSTKTNYAEKALPTQVKSLIAASQKLLVEPGADNPEIAAESNDLSAASSPPEAPKAAASRASTPAPTGQGQLLRSPTALRACLQAIGAGQLEPVAVDLARYAGREAAIIVLPADGGGYEVWVVARDCRADSDGTIDVVRVNP
jgi:hypothetical protein